MFVLLYLWRLILISLWNNSHKSFLLYVSINLKKIFPRNSYWIGFLLDNINKSFNYIRCICNEYVPTLARSSRKRLRLPNWGRWKNTLIYLFQSADRLRILILRGKRSKLALVSGFISLALFRKAFFLLFSITTN